MAWRSHGNDNNSLVDALHANGIIKSMEVREGGREEVRKGGSEIRRE